MPDVIRYRDVAPYASLHAHPEGDWVSFDDYASLAAEVLRLRGYLREADLQLAYLDERQPTGTTPAIRARIAAALKGAAE